jgi:hypothetical protein
MNATRLRGVAQEKQAAVAEAVSALVGAVNDQSTKMHSSIEESDISVAAMTAASHAPRVTASIVDFARLVSESAHDPGAPPDAALPVLEDDLHFGLVTHFLVFLYSDDTSITWPGCMR